MDAACPYVSLSTEMASPGTRAFGIESRVPLATTKLVGVSEAAGSLVAFPHIRVPDRSASVKRRAL